MMTMSQYIIIRPNVTSLYLLIIQAMISVPPVLPLFTEPDTIPKNPVDRTYHTSFHKILTRAFLTEEDSILIFQNHLKETRAGKSA